MEYAQQESHIRSGSFEQLGYRISGLAKTSFEVFRNELSWLGSNLSLVTKLMSGVIVLFPMFLICLTVGLIMLAVSGGVSVQSASFYAAAIYAVLLGIFVIAIQRSISARENEQIRLDRIKLNEDFLSSKQELQEALMEVKDKALETVNPVHIVKKNPEAFIIGSFAAGLLLAAYTAPKKK